MLLKVVIFLNQYALWLNILQKSYEIIMNEDIVVTGMGIITGLGYGKSRP